MISLFPPRSRLFPVLLAALFCLSCTARADVVTAIFNAASDVPVTASTYTAAGNSVDLTLNFAPVTGTGLTVVNNTGLPFINGTFSNLAQGQKVTLTYAGLTYTFAADYFGGTGNDLVLQWADTRLTAWGVDSAGQLGNGAMTCSPLAAAVNMSGVLAGKTVTKVAAGSAYCLVLCSDGTMYAWGSNTSGQLGNGTTISSAVPVAVDQTGVLAGKTVVSICSGSGHALVLCSDGTLAGWGSNSGALGNNSYTSSNVPVLVSIAGTALEGKTVTAIAAGMSTSFAVCSDGTVAAWGMNYNGQLGINNSAVTRSLVPMAVATQGTALQGKTVTAIAAGDFHALALCSDGKVVAWGDNFSGQLGNSSTTSSIAAVAVTTTGTALQGRTVKAIAAGLFANSVALCTDGTVVAWGSNLYGGLGTGTIPVGGSGGTSNVPVAVNSSGVLATRTVISLRAGGAFVQVLCSDGTVVMWGENGAGELGNGRLTHSGVPGLVTTTGTALEGKTVSAVTTGIYHSLALCSDGTLVAWGDNGSNRLGSGGASAFGTPVAVSSTGVLNGKTVVRAATGKTHSLLLCADGTLAACGDNGYGQLGNGGSSYKLEPWPVTTSGVLSGKTVVAVAAGDYHSLVLCSDGTMATWGSASVGQLGNGSSTDANVPVAVTRSGVLAGKTVVAISAGSLHNLALCSDGTLVSWGSSNFNQLGIGVGAGTRNVPVLVSMTGALAGQSVVCISAGNSHSLALCSDGTVAGWGRNSSGQLGNGTTSGGAIPLVATVTGTALDGKTVVKVIGGSSCSFAVCSDGSMAFWGSVSLNPITTSNVPKQMADPGVLATRKVKAIAGGNLFTLALCTDGTLTAWGADSNATGTLTSSTVPATVDTSSFADGERFSAVFTSASASHSIAVVASPAFPPPAAVTLAASSITGTSATLNGTVTANMMPADVGFEFGTGVSYGGSVAGSPSQVAVGPAAAVSGLVTGLTPRTTYHFRVNGTSTSGTRHGDDLTFTTLNNNAGLSGLGLSIGSLSPVFASATLSYTMTVPYWASSLAVIPAASDSHATIAVQVDGGDFVPVASGSASGSLALNADGPTAIQVKVTAEDGSTLKTYVITVAAKTPLERWQQSHFGAAPMKTGHMEDFDGDGFCNLMEFAFGTDPAASTSNASPLSYAGNVIKPGGATSEIIAGVPTAEFIRRSDYAAAGLVYTVEFSVKLKTWETYQGTPVVLATDGTHEVVGIAYPILSDGARAKFFRVTAGMAP